MNSDDRRDQLIDMLLREVVGGETPPDVRDRVMAAAAEHTRQQMIPRQGAPTRRVIVPMPAPRSRSPLLAIAAILAVLAAGMAFVHFREIAKARTPELTRIEGSVDRSAGALGPGERVSTGARSRAILTYPDGTAVELAPETTIRVSARAWGNRSKGLDLIRGRIHAEVAPQTPGNAMVLSAGHAHVEVVGTRLSFQHDADRTRVEVTEGAVRFIPRAENGALLVRAGAFAEVGKSGVRTGAIAAPPRRGIIRFTLMNADTDEPLRKAPLADGETISLASLPTPNINLRADYEGDAPTSVRFTITHDDGQPTGLPPFTSEDQIHPPFFAAGDYWPEGRPNDCRAWTPRPGLYHISAEAGYSDAVADAVKPLSLSFQITP